ncbi:hypothetical protein K439DRAFT_1630465 [Ramaria rubella]|nr:hypothetical protein K439DRAFT_1630465 [Ramaria rubella]
MPFSNHICIRNYSPPTFALQRGIFTLRRDKSMYVFPPSSPYLLLKTPRVSILHPFLFRAANTTQLKDVKGLSVIGGIWDVALCFSEQTFGL